MAFTIPLGATVIFDRPDGSVDEYVFKGGNPLTWEDKKGGQHTHVENEPFTRVQIIPPM